MNIPTSVLLIGANLNYRARLLKHKFGTLVEVFRTTVNWWGALAVYFGLISNVSVKFRDTSISFPLRKENWGDYYSLTRILLSNIRYLNGDRFQFSRPNGLGFDCYDKSLNFYADASGMECYRTHSNDVVCEVAGLKFIVPFPYGTDELKEIFIDKAYGEPCCHNAVVVDVGASIGDSSLFFCK